MRTEATIASLAVGPDLTADELSEIEADMLEPLAFSAHVSREARCC